MSRTVPLPLRKKRIVTLPEPVQFVDTIKGEFDELDRKIELLRERCNFEESLSLEVTQYYALREELKNCRDLYYQLKESIERRDTASSVPRIETNLRVPRGRSMKLTGTSGDKLYFDDQRAADAIREVAEEGIEPTKKKSVEALRWLLAAELEYVKVMYESFGQEDEVTFYLRCLTSKRDGRVDPMRIGEDLLATLRCIFVEALGYESYLGVLRLTDSGHLEAPKLVNQAMSKGGENVLVGTIRGVGARRIAQVFEGLYALKQEGILYRLGLLEGNKDLFNKDEMSPATPKIEVLQRDVLLNIDQELTPDQTELRGEISIETRVEIENSDGLTFLSLFGEEGEKGASLFSEESGRRVFLDWLLLDRVGVEVDHE
jgi:hypothetical protein